MTQLNSKILMKQYKGVIVQESLIDDRQLNDFEIVDFKVTDEEDPKERWHMFTVMVTEQDIQNVADNLRSTKWYANFSDNENMIVVFPKKIFKFRLDDVVGRGKAVEYGRSIEIPEEQLDF